MGRLVYVSFLGTNDYLAAKYRIDDFVSEPTKFVQEADIKYLMNKNEEISEYIFFISDVAEKKNWNDNLAYGHREDFEEGFKGLKTILFDKLRLNKGKVSKIDIEDILYENGKLDTQTFTYKLFERIFNEIKNDSELIIDITHSFRSIPFVAFSAFKYLTYTKNVKIKHIFYGAFEDLGPINKVKDIPIEKRIANIVDLKPLLFLEDWASAVEDFKLYGRLHKLKNLSTNEEFIKSLDSFEEIFILGNGKEMYKGDKIDNLKDSLNKEKIVDIPELNEVVKNVKSYFLEELDKYGEENIENILKGIEFLYGKKQFNQAITLIIELLFSYLCIKYDKKKDKCLNNPHRRDRYRSICYILFKGDEENEKKWKVKNETERKRIREVLNKIDKDEKDIIEKVYSEMINLRNLLNHGGFNKEESISFKDLREKIKKSLEEIKKLLKEN